MEVSITQFRRDLLPLQSPVDEGEEVPAELNDSSLQEEMERAWTRDWDEL